MNERSCGDSISKDTKDEMFNFHIFPIDLNWFQWVVYLHVDFNLGLLPRRVRHEISFVCRKL